MFLEKFKYINIDTNLFNKICDNLNTITPDNILCDNNHRDKNNYVLILIENNVLDFIIKHNIKLYYTYDKLLFFKCDNLNAIKETNNIYVFKTVDYLNILLKLLAMQIRNIIIYYNYMENENVHKYIYNVNELYEKNVIDCYFYGSSTIITNNIEKKNQGTNENHLGAIFRNFSNFLFRQNFMTKNIMEKQEFTVPLGV